MKPNRYASFFWQEHNNDDVSASSKTAIERDMNPSLQMAGGINTITITRGTQGIVKSLL